jgi:hypothetical protein
MVSVSVEQADLLRMESPLIALGVFEDAGPGPQIERLDALLGGLIRRLRDQGEISGKPKRATVLNTTTLAGAAAAIRPERVAILGLGKQREPSLEGVCTAWAESSWPVLRPYQQKDLATGVGVRLLTYFARSWPD